MGAIETGDIIIPEWVGWTRDDVRTWNKLAKGDDKVRAALLANAAISTDGTAGYKNSLINTIHDEGEVAYRQGKGKTVAFIDRTGKEMAEFPAVKRIDPGANPEEMIHNYGLALATNAYETVARNHTMLANLGPTVSDIVSRNPRLRTQERVEVVFAGGLMHTAPFLHLQGSPDMADRVEVDIHEPEGLSENLYVTRIKRAFEELRMPTRREMIDCISWDALNGYPMQLRYVIHELMAGQENTPQLAYAIVTQNLTKDVVDAITQYIDRAEAILAQRTKA